MPIFNWFPADGDKPVVSPSGWVVIVVAAVLTAVTVGLWYLYNMSAYGRRFKQRWKEKRLSVGSISPV